GCYPGLDLANACGVITPPRLKQVVRRCVVFSKAIVRPPSANFAEGLSTAHLGTPDYARALQQHEAYCLALKQCGLELVRLEACEQYPDSTFVEDTAVLTEQCAILTPPGAPSRFGEVSEIGK